MRRSILLTLFYLASFLLLLVAALAALEATLALRRGWAVTLRQPKTQE